MNEIVQAVSHNGHVYIFMRNGDIYRMVVNQYDWEVEFHRIHRFNPHD